MSEKIRIIAIDFDGTLACPGEIALSELKEMLKGGPGPVILPEVRQTLKKAVAYGIKLSMVTGRAFNQLFEKILLNSNIKPLDGIFHFMVMEEKYIYYLESGEYVEDEEWNSTRKKDLEKLQKKIGWKTKEILNHVKKKLNPVDEHCGYGELHLAFSSLEETIEAQMMLEKLIKRFPNGTIVRNGCSTGIDIKNGGKGRCLEYISQRFNIKRNEILVIGDSQNDESMLDEKLGFKTATVSNAEEKIKELVLSRGGYVSPRPYGYGVIDIIERLCRL